MKSGAQHMTLYTGLTAVLHVKSAPDGQIRLDAHQTHRKAGRFDEAWSTPHSVAEWFDLWPEVDLYLERVIPAATESHGRTEGAVQAAVGSFRTRSRLVLDREVTPSFRDKDTKKKILDACRTPILEALTAADLDFKGQPKSLGAECDAWLSMRRGRVLAVEIKPLSAGSVAWVPAQALMYARVLQRWMDEDPVHAREVLTGMAAQRRALGLAPVLGGRPSRTTSRGPRGGRAARRLRRIHPAHDRGQGRAQGLDPRRRRRSRSMRCRCWAS